MKKCWNSYEMEKVMKIDVKGKKKERERVSRQI
jgi:hypothetical protein